MSAYGLRSLIVAAGESEGVGAGQGNIQLATTTAAVAFRFVAPQTITLAKVSVFIPNTSTPPVLEVRVESDGGANDSDPSGTLAWANANGTMTPTANAWNDVTLTATGTLTAGTVYWVKVKYSSGTVDGTHYAYVSYNSGWVAQARVKTSADGTTWTGISGVNPQLLLTDNGGVKYESSPFSAYNGTTAGQQIYSTRRSALKFVVPASTIWTVYGYKVHLQFSGTTQAALKLYILDSSNSLVTGTTVTIPRSALHTSNIDVDIWLPVAVALGANTYRLVMAQSGDGGDSSNWYQMTYLNCYTGMEDDSGTAYSESTAGDGGTWTDTPAVSTYAGVYL